ncbi:MAG TPA: tRNA epoxyqueuosine(34) reductase QueG [Burkholderiaceae bacterium]|nr:tRNA epoxyqueuosine(34) reductase QueG [Burkholderiaceae bacterium]
MAVNEVARPGKDNDADALRGLAASIKAWGREIGFGAVAIADVDMTEPSRRLQAWLAAGRHGEMAYMANHASLRADPSQLLPGVVRAICARLDYRPRDDDEAWIERESARLDDSAAAVVSMYARGRDYHKVLRDRLQKLATRIGDEVGSYRYRVCTDSAPVFEIELARRGGLGWRGKHTLLLAREAGSMFFLGEILTDLPLPVDAPVADHCGTCQRCIDVCPTRAITAPYQLDARRCISYLTIEHKSAIPEQLRGAIGNRVYGCDDCQIACPWNKYAQVTSLADFDVRNGLDRARLIELFAWSEEEFRRRHAGSAVLRIGYERWLRNIAVGLGNAGSSPEVVAALRARADHPSALVREHVAWALSRHAPLSPCGRAAGGEG